jgi:hypothetical protein
MADTILANVDLVVLSRDYSPLHPEVERGLQGQQGVQTVVHRVIGQPLPNDECRQETIARARNEGKLRGNAPWLMFVDDDVVLEADCVRTLVQELGRRPAFAALAADYLGERRGGEIATHVSMGATLFRREALDAIWFRWNQPKCECRCCCDDLRRMHWGIDYCRSARARHLNRNEVNATELQIPSDATSTGHVLTAFNRQHRRYFQQQFLQSLRSSGNWEPVIAVALGLYPSERLKLQRLPRVSAALGPDHGVHVGRQKLREFQVLLRNLPADAPVAYWDAGDVVFQGRLQPLWEIVRAYPDKILAVREPAGHPENRAVENWTQIADPAARRRTQDLLFNNPFLNSGFMAGTAQTLYEYCRTATEWYDNGSLEVSADPLDQIAFNVYCHSNPDIWHEVPESWNYCLCLRDLSTVYRDENGKYIDVRGLPIYAVHGNARTLQTVRIRGARRHCAVALGH